MTTPQELFRKALEDLETNGWHQGDYFTGWQAELEAEIPQECPSCAMGALLRATGEPTFDGAINHPALEAAEDLLLRYIRRNPVFTDTGFVFGIGQWNDHADRTKDEVLEALHELANTEE